MAIDCHGQGDMMHYNFIINNEMWIKMWNETEHVIVIEGTNTIFIHFGITMKTDVVFTHFVKKTS